METLKFGTLLIFINTSLYEIFSATASGSSLS